MRSPFPAVLLLVLSCSAGLAAAAPGDAQELRARRGLANIFSKLQVGGDAGVRIGYFGGSITAARGWRVKSLAWLKKRYPQAAVSEINGAIGGTGSDLGVFRLGQDLLTHKPDLLFVEFAVNDGGAPVEQIYRAMEGIVRQTWRADPDTDICFVYTVSLPFLASLQAGENSRSVRAMEEIAEHYGIPSIHLGLETARMVTDGELVFKAARPTGEDLLKKPWVFSSDGVHPFSETGHELYLEALVRSWEQMEVASPARAAHDLVAPFRDDNWEAAKLVPLGEALREGAWERLDQKKNPIARRFRTRMPEMWRAAEPGAAVRFRFRGTVVGIYDIVGPDCGQVEIVLDGGPPKTLRRMDSHCTYHRLGKFQIGAGLDAGTVHEVRVSLSPEGFDKRELLFERNRTDFDKDPGKYEGLNWYAGAVMLVGELAQ